MASMTISTVISSLPLQRNRSLFYQAGRPVESVAFCNAREGQRLFFSYGIDSKRWPLPLHAVGPGLEASMSGKSKYDLRLDDAKISVESLDNDKITITVSPQLASLIYQSSHWTMIRLIKAQLRVDLTGEETEKAFDTVLTNLARTAPPIPGFRKMKGGKTSNVPKSFLLQMLGRDRVTKFLIQEVVSITIGDYVKKENLKANSEFKTIQTAEELEAAFTPGSEFCFTAVVDIESSG